MIIKNGFVRTSDGEWLNLRELKEFYCNAKVLPGAEVGFVIRALPAIDEGDASIEISEEYETLEDAQTVLDTAFGVIGV